MKHSISGVIKLISTVLLVVFIASCGGKEERKVKYLENGKAYLEEKNYGKARVEFKNVLQIDPKFADAYFYLGQLEEENKELGKALANYKKAVELNPQYIEAKIKLAKIYVIAGTDDFVEMAKKLLSEVKVEQPENTEAKLILATIKYKSGAKKEATKALESVLNEDKQLVEGVSLLANIYMHEGKEDKAVALLRKGVLDNPKNFQIRLTLAKLLAKNNELVEAETYLKQVIEIEPERYSLQVALSSFYASSNQLDKAESVLRESIKQDPEDALRYLVLVEMLSSRIGFKKADEELKSAISNNPELYDLKFAQVSFYQKIGKREEAKAVLERIIADKSYEIEGVKARNLLAGYLLQEGDQKGARKYIDDVMKEHPNNLDSLLISSKLALRNLDAVSAINGLRTVIKSDPNNAEATLLLAQAHEFNNESALAENELKKSLELNPLNDQAHANYARYLASKGRVDEAVDVVDKALTYFKESYELMSMKLKVLSSQGKDTEVIALLNVMEQANPDKSEINIIKGQFYFSKHEIPKAIVQFEHAYSKSQNKLKALELIVRTYLANNQPSKAIDRLKKITESNPDDATAIFLEGQVYLSQKKIPEAREKFLLASKAAESWLPPYEGLAATYLVEENIDKALAIYKSAIPKLKNKSAMQMKLASLYEKKKKFSAAMSVYQEILSDNAGNKLAVNNYASLLLDYGNDSDAVKALELTKGFEKFKQRALRDTLAWANAKTGDSAKAIEILKPIVDKAPKIAVFRYHLGYALYHIGDKAAAKSHLELAASSDQQFHGKDEAAKLLKTL